MKTANIPADWVKFVTPSRIKKLEENVGLLALHNLYYNRGNVSPDEEKELAKMLTPKQRENCREFLKKIRAI
jgi:hypothetical protein